MTQRYLQWADYLVFVLVLVVSAAVGIYHACSGGKQRTTGEFLMANRQMGVFPVTLSLLASFMSAITLLGTPAEIYIHGTQYVWIGFAYLGVLFFSTQLYLPVFYRLQVTSAYEYLGKRFSKALQVIGAMVFIVQMSIYMGIVLYAPSLALNAVTGFNLWAAVFSVGIVCTFYTTLGGIKAVMWTDVFQIIMMFVGLFAVLIRGIVINGGMGNIWKLNYEGGRIDFFNFNVDPTERHTVWSLAIGGIFTWTGIYGVNQTMVQRALTLPSYRRVRKAFWLNYPGLTSLMLLCSICGLCVYATYKDCDPVRSGQITANDQLMPLFVMDHLNYPGLPGLFTACLFSAALSTVSSGLNSLSAVTLHDLVYLYKPNITPKTALKVSKGLSLGYGLFCLLFAYVASKMGQILQAALGLFGMMSGPLLGLFTLGMLFPCVTWKGAIVGHLVAQIVTFWIGFGYYVYNVKAAVLPVSLEGCINGTLNSTLSMISSPLKNVTILDSSQNDIPVLYKISYMWYSFIGFITAIIVALLVTGLFKFLSKIIDTERHPIFAHGYQSIHVVDPVLLAPLGRYLFCCCPMSVRKCVDCGKIRDYDENECEADLEHSIEDKNGMLQSYQLTNNTPPTWTSGETTPLT